MLYDFQLVIARHSFCYDWITNWRYLYVFLTNWIRQVEHLVRKTYEILPTETLSTPRVEDRVVLLCETGQGGRVCLRWE